MSSALDLSAFNISHRDIGLQKLLLHSLYSVA